MRTAVIGAGMAGLGAARRLQRRGRTPVVFEADDRVGGRIKTIRRAGFTFDVGAFIYLGSYGEAAQEMRLQTRSYLTYTCGEGPGIACPAPDVPLLRNDNGRGGDNGRQFARNYPPQYRYQR
jgi:phytoene dehydrogenase-like protein